MKTKQEFDERIEGFVGYHCDSAGCEDVHLPDCKLRKELRKFAEDLKLSLAPRSYGSLPKTDYDRGYDRAVRDFEEKARRLGLEVK